MEKIIKLGVVSSSSFYDSQKLFNILDKVRDKISLLIHTETIGAGPLVEEYAAKHKIDRLTIYANKDRGGHLKRAQKLVEAADWIFIFWDGESRGAALYLSHAERLKKKYKIYKFTP